MKIDTIKNRLRMVNDNIYRYCKQAKRVNKDVTLLAVSKRHSVKSIESAYHAGQRHFGENYLNEALDKQKLLSSYNIIWHYIGSIQSNKTKKIAEYFSWVHSVDSLKIATRLSNQRAGLPDLNICLQINIDGEDSKSGLYPNDLELYNLAKKVAVLPNINLRGLMCIPAPKKSREEEIKTFAKMNVLLQRLNQQGLKIDTLSMGMSVDLDSAIFCGATIVRVGTAIFGTRK